MTIRGSALCNLIQSFPLLLIIAQKTNRCLETPFIYKPPTPTQSPEYYEALDALFQTLYGHGYSEHDAHPCYSSSQKYSSKPCHTYPQHTYNYGNPFSSHGTSYGTTYGSHGTGYGTHGTGYGTHGTAYGTHGTGHGSHGTVYTHGNNYFVPGYKKGNIYSANVSHGYASSQGYTTNNRYKVVVKKTRIGKTKRKSGNLRDASGACKTSNGGTGTCVPLSSCEPLMALRGVGSNPKDGLLLQQAHCGFNGNEPKVCCPVEQKANVIDPDTPASTTQAPSTTTLTPFTTAQTPSTATQAPTSTQASWTISRAPSMTTQAASNTSTTQGKLENAARINLSSTYNYDLITLLGETCTTVYNNTGICQELTLCEPFSALIKTGRSNPAHRRILRQSYCGIIGTKPKVCCPLPGQPTTMTPPVTVLPSNAARGGGNTLTSHSRPPVPGVNSVSPNKVVIGVPANFASGACKTSNGGTGTCAPLSSCEPLMAMLRGEVSNPIPMWLLRQAHCGFNVNEPKVCCPVEQKANVIDPDTPAPTTQAPSTTTLTPFTTAQTSSTATQAPTSTLSY